MTTFSVDTLARRYSRVLLSRRLLRAFAAATLLGALLLLLTAAIAPLVILAADAAPAASSGVRLALAALGLAAFSVATFALAVLYLHVLSRLAVGSRRAITVLLAVIAVWLAVVVVSDVMSFVQPAATYPFHSLALGSLVIHAITAWALAVGPFELWRADAFSREVFGDPRSGAGRLAHAARLLDLPDVRAFNRTGKMRAWLFVGLALLLEGLAFFTWLKWANSLVDGADRQLAPDAVTLGPVVFNVLLFIGTVAVLFFSFTLIRWMLRGARRLRLAARRATIESAEAAVAADTRPPVLFLRSFVEEQVPLTGASTPWFLRGFDPGTEYRTLEEMIVYGLSYLGPVVAVADPSKGDLPIGAARWRLPDESWQTFVATQIRQASLVVVGVGNTPGLGWEIDALKQSPEALATAIFVCPPGATRDASMLRHLAGLLDVPADGVDRLVDAARTDHVLTVAMMPSGATCFLSRQLTENAYYVALRACIARQRESRAPHLALAES